MSWCAHDPPHYQSPIPMKHQCAKVSGKSLAPCFKFSPDGNLFSSPDLHVMRVGRSDIVAKILKTTKPKTDLTFYYDS